MYQVGKCLNLLVLCFILSPLCQAMPMIGFSADLDYTASDHVLRAQGIANSVQDLPTSFDVFVGSDIQFSSMLSSILNFGPLSIGSFSDSGDLSIVGSGGEILLTADLSEVSLAGLVNTNTGVFEADLMVTGGSFGQHFMGPNDLFSLVFNLTTNFSPDIYDTDFSGVMNGQIEFNGFVVSEPNVLGLAVLGCFALWRQRRRNSRMASESSVALDIN